MKYLFFTDAEVKGLDLELAARLESARHFADMPFIITSGLRTPEQNARVGGVADSSHLKGLAVDLAIDNSLDLFRCVSALYLAGFKRIGIYFTERKDGTLAPSHVHVDSDETKPQRVLFLKRENK